MGKRPIERIDEFVKERPQTEVVDEKITPSARNDTLEYNLDFLR